MSQQQIRQNVKQAINTAIQQGIQPKAPRNGLGLVLNVPGARFRTLFDEGGLAPAARYYYEEIGIDPPDELDYQQDAIRRGRSQYIKLLDSTQRKISTWDNVGRQWKLTALGKKFYSKAVDKFTV